MAIYDLSFYGIIQQSHVSGAAGYGGIAQLGERLHGMQEVMGSNPTISTEASVRQKPLFCCVTAKIPPCSAGGGNIFR